MSASSQGLTVPARRLQLHETHLVVEPVRLEGDAVRVDGFVETDPDVVQAVRAAADPVGEVHRQLAMGARVLRLASSTVDTETVRTELDTMTVRLAGAVDAAVGRFATVAKDLLDDETGALATRNRDLLGRLQGLLGDTFDPSRAGSATAAVEQVLARAGEQQLTHVRALLSPDVPDSVLGRFRGELTTVLTGQLEQVRGELRGLAEQVATQAAARAAAEQVYAQTAAKGLDFEEQLYGYVEQCALAQQDLAVRIGTETGSRGSKKGDVTVTLNPQDTSGRPGTFVLEVKDRKLSMLKTLAELDAAMANRDARVGLAVFASQEQAPTSLPFVWHDTKAVLVVDRDSPDPGAVRLAYAWARWMTLRDLPGAGDELDLIALQALLEDGQRALTRRSTIRRAHAAAHTKLTEAGTAVDALVTDLQDVLDALALHLRAPGAVADPAA